MTTIYLVRHGNTEWTGHRVIGLTPGVHLNQTGCEQALRAAEYLQRSPIEAIYSSPMERATDTAAPLAKMKNLPVIPVPFLCSVDFGDFQKRTKEELAEEPIWQQFLTHPAGVCFPSGESIKDAQQRIVYGINSLAMQYPENVQIACFAHCEILRLAIAHALKIPLDDYMRLTLDTGSISCIEWGSNYNRLKWLNRIP
jgi:broad specificity phosphatase PhoE